jgi:hypothetical protein
MSGRRPLADLLDELGSAAAGVLGGALAVGARSMSMTLPIDIRLAPRPQGVELLGDVPLFRTRTAFDPEPGRIEVHWHAVPVAAAGGQP